MKNSSDSQGLRWFSNKEFEQRERTLNLFDHHSWGSKNFWVQHLAALHDKHVTKTDQQLVVSNILKIIIMCTLCFSILCKERRSGSICQSLEWNKGKILIFKTGKLLNCLSWEGKHISHSNAIHYVTVSLSYKIFLQTTTFFRKALHRFHSFSSQVLGIL